MLKLVVKAGIPVIAASTRDTMVVPEMLTHILGVEPIKYEFNKTPIEPKKVFFWANLPDKVGPIIDQLYEKFEKKESVLILINASKLPATVFNVGELATPRSMVHELLVAITGDAKKADALLPAFGGCSSQEAVEFARITMARDGGMTVNGVVKTRKSIFTPSKGVTLVDTDVGFYKPPTEIQEWLATEAWHFKHGKDPRLIPRGLLLDGPPGTGKTQASKHIASELGVPLYRFDFGNTKTKWLGESEDNMLMALRRLDQEEPCVVLMDEAEKMFGEGGYDGGTSANMFSQLLWWLAEHRSRVLTVMTTNNKAKLPKELYRPGRIDTVMWFNGLEAGEGFEFAKEVAATFKGVTLKPHVIAEATTKLYEKSDGWVSQSTITRTVYTLVKAALQSGNLAVQK